MLYLQLVVFAAWACYLSYVIDKIIIEDFVSCIVGIVSFRWLVVNIDIFLNLLCICYLSCV